MTSSSIELHALLFKEDWQNAYLCHYDGRGCPLLELMGSSKPSDNPEQGEDIAMKKLAIFLISFFALIGCATNGKTPSHVSKQKPDTFCQVIKEPAPLLMGAWECSFARYVGRSLPDENYVMYKLIKYEDKYALYFYRTWKKGKKKKNEWKNWTINGEEILGEARFGVKIFVRAGDVYFTIRGLVNPAKMSPVKDQ